MKKLAFAADKICIIMSIQKKLFDEKHIKPDLECAVKEAEN